jgi:hypothetical protein
VVTKKWPLFGTFYPFLVAFRGLWQLNQSLEIAIQKRFCSFDGAFEKWGGSTPVG